MDQVRVNVTPNEIVPQGKHIEFQFGEPIETHELRKHISLRSGAVRRKFEVELDDHKRTLCIQPEGDAIGPCTLKLHDIRDQHCKVIVHELTVDFCVLPISGAIPSEFRIVHAVRVKPEDAYIRRLPLGACDDGFFDVVKAEHRASRKPQQFAFDHAGQTIDYASVVADVERERAERSGLVSEVLRRKLEQSPASDTLPIIVWARISLPATPVVKRDCESGGDDGESAEPDNCVDDQVFKAVEEVRQALEGLELKAGNTPESSVVLPYLRANANAEQIQALAAHAAVGGIFLDDQAGINDLEDSIRLAHSDRAHAAGAGGKDVRVAVWEEGPSPNANLVFSGAYLIPPVVSGRQNDLHARLTSAIVKSLRNGEDFGHAPNCLLFSANSFDEAALHWAHTKAQVNVLSQSFHRDQAGFTAEFLHDDLLKDYLACREPYPTIVQAAGNLGEERPPSGIPIEQEIVNHKGYNSLRVGSHDDDGRVVDSSIYKNPRSDHGDRELPELAANGSGVTALEVTSGGTSFAAPAVAGVAALIQGRSEALKRWPEACRAILLAGASRSFSRPGWFEDVKAHVESRDGAGNLDAETSVRIVEHRAARDLLAGGSAWNGDTLSTAEVDDNKLSKFAYRFQVPDYRAPLVRVALAWDATLQARDGLLVGSRLSVDLDLCVFDDTGALVAESATHDNNYEIAQFRAVRGRSYEVRIRRWAGSENLWYGIAWTTHETQTP